MEIDINSEFCSECEEWMNIIHLSSKVSLDMGEIALRVCTNKECKNCGIVKIQKFLET
jgi:hypothetical protein